MLSLAVTRDSRTIGDSETLMITAGDNGIRTQDQVVLIGTHGVRAKMSKVEREVEVVVVGEMPQALVAGASTNQDRVRK